MTQSDWYHCSSPIRAQVNTLVEGCQQIIGDNLIGVYLHGSLATGCHNPDRSDIDLLIVTERGMDVETKRSLAELFLHHERQPRQLEVSSLTWAQLHPWQYPTPFDFHNGDWIENDLTSGAWRQWNESVRTDPDIAAHITITNHRGITLVGKPITNVFPAVPAEHYRESILLDFDWGLERIHQRPTYFTLNACRIAAYLHERLVLSKDEGGEWGLSHAPIHVKEVIQRALEIYRGQASETELDKQKLINFIEWVTPLIKPQ
jgi:streptomycin 3"-adenylyltransferase